MKKILLTAIAVAFLWACSNESEQHQKVPDSLSIDQKSTSLGDLYNTMVQSSSYKIFHNAQKTFSQKMNFTGAVGDIDSETKILTWISNNINSTSFTNFQNATNSWADLKSKQKNVMTENAAFFSLLHNSGKDSLYPIIHEPYVPVTTGCQEDCNTLNEGCEGFADAYFSAGLEYASGYLANGNFNAALTIAVVSFVDYTYIMAGCQSSHTECLKGC